ncbi:MAG TPA: AraC family transcriptional regulator [Mycobacterium sp.]|nr:AraC family transcriptional regulator [Mycobacterium sp.]
MSAVYREYRPERPLLPFVECGWVRSESANRSIRVMPDGCVDLFLTSEGNLMVAGPATTCYDQAADQESVLAGLRLRPGAAAAVLGQPASELTDTRIPIDSVFGAARHRMTEDLLAATTPGKRVAVLQTMLTESFARAEPVLDQPVVRAVQILRRHPDWSVSRLAAEVGLSERQLRRRFMAAVGYGPKRLGRIFRLQRLLDLIHAADGRIRWAELAIEARYADQSHMINECSMLAGVTPAPLPVARAINAWT